MISPSEASRYMQRSLHSLSVEVPATEGIYSTLQAFKAYACRVASERNYARLQECFNIAASLYERGSGVVRCAVENVFVFSFSQLFAIAADEKQKVKALIPASLRTLYINQVLHRGY